MLTIRHIEYTEQSTKKATNDDFFLSAPDMKLFVICDGVSGHAGGNVASKVAAETAAAYVRQKLAGGAVPPLKEAALLARDAVLFASKTVFERAQADPKLTKMATTLDLVWLIGNRLVSAHTGDSRVYILRQGQLVRFTRDHTYVQDLIENGSMTEEQAKKSPYAHTLVHAVGIRESTRVDLLAPEIQHGDLVFLCTDGIYGGCPDAQITSLLSHAAGNARAALEALVKAARAGGSTDDATAIILEIPHEAAAAHAPGAHAPIAIGTAPPAAAHATATSGDPLPQAKLQALDLTSCFGQLSFADKTRLLELAHSRKLKPGDVLAREGEIADQLWVMITGTVRISEKGVTLVDRTGAMALGEAALMEREPRSATVTAVTDVVLLEFERAKVLAFLDPHMRSPAAQIYRALATMEHHRMRDLSQQVSALKAQQKR